MFVKSFEARTLRLLTLLNLIEKEGLLLLYFQMRPSLCGKNVEIKSSVCAAALKLANKQNGEKFNFVYLQIFAAL